MKPQLYLAQTFLSVRVEALKVCARYPKCAAPCVDNQVEGLTADFHLCCVEQSGEGEGDNCG